MKIKSLSTINLSILDDYKIFSDSNRDWSIESYTNMKYDLNTAIAFGKFYYPDFVEVNNCIILKSRFNSDIFENWSLELNGRTSEIEKICNLYELEDYFHINGVDTDLHKIIEFGLLLKLCYENNLKLLYPEKKFSVILFDEDEKNYITFFQNM